VGVACGKQEISWSFSSKIISIMPPFVLCSLLALSDKKLSQYFKALSVIKVINENNKETTGLWEGLFN
jgi:hypothetical protein